VALALDDAHRGIGDRLGHEGGEGGGDGDVEPAMGDRGRHGDLAEAVPDIEGPG
jgi:hypothetical protein